MKRHIAFLLVLALLALGCGALAEENLLVNGDFSAVTDGMPDGWRTEMWYTDAGVSLLSTIGPTIWITFFAGRL